MTMVPIMVNAGTMQTSVVQWYLASSFVMPIYNLQFNFINKWINTSDKLRGTVHSLSQLAVQSDNFQKKRT